MKHKCYNFTIESKDRVLFLKQVRDEFGFNLTEGNRYLTNLLTDDCTVIEEDEYQFLLGIDYLTFDAKTIGEDHPKYNTKSQAEIWYESLSEEEKGYVTELFTKMPILN